jgi:hypothetical protein
VAIDPPGREAPGVLRLRVLVDRSVVEAFAQGGRASGVAAIYETHNGTSLIWQPSPTYAVTPTFSVAAWPMATAYVE